MTGSVTGSEQPTAVAMPDTATLAGRVLKLMLAINLILPGCLFAFVYLLRTLEVLPSEPLMPADTLTILVIALLFVAVSEIVAAYLVRNAIFESRKVRAALTNQGSFSKLVTAGAITLAALGASPMLFGIVYFILGGPLAHVGLFAILTLLHFRLFRPNVEFLEGLIRREQSPA